jgi:hypothetical protein
LFKYNNKGKYILANSIAFKFTSVGITAYSVFSFRIALFSILHNTIAACIELIKLTSVQHYQKHLINKHIHINVSAYVYNIPFKQLPASGILWQIVLIEQGLNCSTDELVLELIIYPSPESQ